MFSEDRRLSNREFWWLKGSGVSEYTKAVEIEPNKSCVKGKRIHRSLAAIEGR